MDAHGLGVPHDLIVDRVDRIVLVFGSAHPRLPLAQQVQEILFELGRVLADELLGVLCIHPHVQFVGLGLLMALGLAVPTIRPLRSCICFLQSSQ